MTAPELKPCPFCGEKIYDCTYANGKTRWAHGHSNCVISKAFIYDATAWNTRADLHDATKAQLAMAVDALREISAAYANHWLAGRVSRAVLAEIEKGGV
jgi:hypothetical protein